MLLCLWHGGRPYQSRLGGKESREKSRLHRVMTSFTTLADAVMFMSFSGTVSHNHFQDLFLTLLGTKNLVSYKLILLATKTQLVQTQFLATKKSVSCNQKLSFLQFCCIDFLDGISVHQRMTCNLPWQHLPRCDLHQGITHGAIFPYSAIRMAV